MRRASFEALWQTYERLPRQCGDRADTALDKLRWMLEELRVSLFAQSVGTAGKVSVARVERQIDASRTSMRERGAAQ